MDEPKNGELAAWLADTLRERGMVTREPPAEWAGDCCLPFEMQLQYEPRSLAISPNGKTVAIGTKAGMVAFAMAEELPGEQGSPVHWKWTSDSRQLEKPGKTPEADKEEVWRAVRALGFLDDETLVAGTGRGQFYIFKPAVPPSEPGEIKYIKVLKEQPRSYEPWRASDPNHRDEAVPQTWFERPEKWISVRNPQNRLEHLKPGEWQLLGLTVTPSKVVNLLWARNQESKKDANSGEVEAEKPQTDYLATQAEPALALDKRVRLAGGCSGPDGEPCLIDRDGNVYKLVRSTTNKHLFSHHLLDKNWKTIKQNRGRQDLTPKYIELESWFRIVAPLRSKGHFGSVDSLPAHLTISASGSYACIPWPEGNVANDHVIWPNWRAIPGGDRFVSLHVAAGLVAPCQGPQTVPTKQERVAPTEDEPVWQLVTSGAGGIVWIPWWEREEKPAPLISTTRALVRSSAGIGPAEVLFLSRTPWCVAPTAGTPTSLETEKAPLFLAFGTRDHRMVIRGLVDFTKAKEELGKLSLSKEEATTEGTGTVRWRALATMRRDLGMKLEEALPSHCYEDDVKAAESAEKLAQIPGFINRLRPADIRDMTRALCKDLPLAVEQLTPEERTQHTAREGRNFELSVALRVWVLRLLRRSSQLTAEEPNLRVDIAKQLVQVIASLPEVPRRVRHLGSWLRKWIVNGHTYDSKPIKLVDLVSWNLKGGRTLDALTYASKLMHRRADCLMVSRLPTYGPLAGVLALVQRQRRKQDGSDNYEGFSVHAHFDGRITATNLEGIPLTWKVGAGELGIEAGDQRLSIRRSDQNNHSNDKASYARCLLLIKREEKGQELLVIAFQGSDPSNPEGRTGSGSFLVALAIKVVGETIEVDVQSNSEHIEDELYSLNHVRSEGNKIYLLGGTDDSEPERPQAKEWKLPIVELCLDLLEGRLQIERQEQKTSSPAQSTAVSRSARSTLISEDKRYNPVWSLVSTKAEGTGENSEFTDYAWAGQHDGRVRVFGRSQKTGKWVEILEEEIDPQYVGPFHGHSPIATLALHPERKLLAYGTADGTVGLLAPFGSSEAMGLQTQEAQSQVDSKAERSPRLKFPGCQLVHCSLSGWVRGLSFFEDAKSSQLMAVTEQGAVSIFDADFDVLREVGKPKAADVVPQELANRRSLSGAKQEHFRLLVPNVLTAIVVEDGRVFDLKEKEDSKVLSAKTQLLLSTAGGQVLRYLLVVPKKTERRRALAEKFELEFDNADKLHAAAASPGNASEPKIPDQECPSSLFGFAGFMGPLYKRYLRVADRTEMEVLRFSLWIELRAAEGRLWSALSDSNREAPNVTVFEAQKSYLKSFKALADEVFSHQPFSRQPAKTLLEGAGKVASSLASAALKTGCSRRAEYLIFYLNLLTSLDEVARRWFGFDSRIEPAVLMYSFNEVFDWSALYLMAASPRGREEIAETREAAIQGGREEIAETQEKVRNHLFLGWIRKRLVHRDPLVAEEALRQINTSLIRAIDRKFRWGDHGAPLADFELELDANPSGFLALMNLVGDTAEGRLATVAPSSPLFSEIIRFFAGCILLFEESAYIVALIVSESRLPQGPHLRPSQNMVLRIAEMGFQLVRQLRSEFWHRDEEHQRETIPNLLDAVKRFSSYLRIYRADVQLPKPRRFLEPGSEELPGTPKIFTDLALLLELPKIISAERLFQRLPNWSSDEAGDKEDLEKFLELKDQRGVKPVRPAIKGAQEGELLYFNHTRLAFEGLQLDREKLREAMKAEKPDELHQILKQSEAGLLDPDTGLFEPQRTQYLQILRRWDEQLRRDASKATELFFVLDKFLRHRHQAAAMELMVAILELGLQIAPLHYRDITSSKEDPRSLHRILDEHLQHHPIARRVLNAGLAQLNDSQLSTALVQAALHELGRADEASGEVAIVGSSSGREIKNFIERLAAEHSLTIEEQKFRENWPEIVGRRFVWEGILREIIVNIRRYAGETLKFELSEAKSTTYLAFSGNMTAEKSIAPGLRRMMVDHVTTWRAGADRGGFGLVMVRNLASLVGIHFFPVELPFSKLGESAELMTTLNQRKLLEDLEAAESENTDKVPLVFLLAWARKNDQGES